jgi:hemolysin III
MYASFINLLHHAWAPGSGGISLHVLLGSLIKPREPMSTWTHELGAVLSVPAALALWRGSRGGLGKRVSLLVFGLSLAACYGASVTCHAYRGTAAAIGTLSVIDHIGIYVFLAGTYTPIARSALSGARRRLAIGTAWLVAACGSLLHVACGELSTTVATTLHLTASVALAVSYPELTRNLRPREQSLFLAGCGLYGMGAVLNALHWPALFPGVVGSHECFHVFVLAGSVAHFRLLQGIAAQPEVARTGPAATPAISSNSVVVCRSIRRTRFSSAIRSITGTWSLLAFP